MKSRLSVLTKAIFSSSSIGKFTAAAWALLGLHLLFLLASPTDSLRFGASDLIQVVEGLLATLIVGWASTCLSPGPNRQQMRLVWMFLAGASFLWAIGDLVWAIYETVFHLSPTPSPADIFYMVAFLVILIGVFIAPHEPFSMIRLVKNLLDISVVVVSVVVIYWNFLFQPFIGRFLTDTKTLITLGVYPIMELILLVGLLSLVLRKLEDVSQLSLVLLTAGMAVMILTYSVMAYDSLHDIYYRTAFIDISWGLMHFFSILAGLAQVRFHFQRQQQGAPGRPLLINLLSEAWTIVIPYTFLAIDALLLSWHKLFNLPMEDEELGAWVTIVAGLVMARQILVIYENRRLFGDLQQLQTSLEQRVENRTNELKTANAMLLNENSLRSRVENALLYQVNLESKVAQISARFINLDASQLDDEIDHSMEDLALLIGADRGYVFLFAGDYSHLEIKFGWQKYGVGPEPDQFIAPETDEIPWWMDQLHRLKPFMISEVAQLPPEAKAESRLLTSQGVASIIAAPLSYRKRLLGFLGFDILQPGRSFPDQDLAAFALLADAFAQAIERKKVENDLVLRTNQLEALRQIGLETNAELELTALLNLVTHWAQKLVEADAGGFFLFNSNLNQLKLEISLGSSMVPIGSIVKIGEGLSGRALAEKSPQMTPLYTADDNHMPRYGHYFPGGVIAIPVFRGDDRLGVLTMSYDQEHQFSQNEVNILTLFAAQAAIAIQNAQLYEKIHSLAITDPLTEVYNRRHFFEQASIEIERARRYHKNLAILILDIDHFKRVNDELGHLAGDEVLRQLVARCESLLRDSDLFSRYGGEEFIILLPETNLERAITVGERLRCAVCESPFVFEDHLITLTISGGLATFEESIPDISSLLKKADEAMYAAKNAGRNRVEIFRPNFANR